MGTAVPDNLFAVLQQLESRFLWPGPEISDAQLEALVAEDFHEIGASGRRFDRQYGLAVLRERRMQTQLEPWTRLDEHLYELQPGVVLLSYRLERGEKISMRSTVWRRTLDGEWQAVFHQGTRCGWENRVAPE